MGEKVSKCGKCGGKLSRYELSDNIYAGLDENDYICYSYQSDIVIEDDDYLDE